VCDLCDPETRERAQKEAERLSLSLKDLALTYAGLARGRIAPHTAAFSDKQYVAKRII
jgi:hypothetical protein